MKAAVSRLCCLSHVIWLMKRKLTARWEMKIEQGFWSWVLMARHFTESRAGRCVRRGRSPLRSTALIPRPALPSRGAILEKDTHLKFNKIYLIDLISDLTVVQDANKEKSHMTRKYIPVKLHKTLKLMYTLLKNALMKILNQENEK